MNKRLKEVLDALGAAEYIRAGKGSVYVTFVHDCIPYLELTKKARVKITEDTIKIIDERGVVFLMYRRSMPRRGV